MCHLREVRMFSFVSRCLFQTSVQRPIRSDLTTSWEFWTQVWSWRHRAYQNSCLSHFHGGEPVNWIKIFHQGDNGVTASLDFLISIFIFWNALFLFQHLGQQPPSVKSQNTPKKKKKKKKQISSQLLSHSKIGAYLLDTHCLFLGVAK